MRVFNLSKDLATAAWIVGNLPPSLESSPPGLTASFLVKATFKLRQGSPPEAWATPGTWERKTEFPCGDKNWDGDPKLGICYASDFVPYKPCADFALLACAYAPSQAGSEPFLVRARVGDVEKRLRVYGERRWKAGTVEGWETVSRVDRVPLHYANAWGGPEIASNPLGCGHDSAHLHKIEHEDVKVDRPSEDIEPAGFAPIPMLWPQRWSKIGTYDSEWKDARWPWLATDLDWTFFNAAPASQWFPGYLIGDEQLEFENLHASHSLYRTTLPGLQARCFINRLEKPNPEFAEVSLALDTLWVDLEQEKLILVWRGRHPVKSPKLLDVDHLLVFLEPLAAKKEPLAFYRDLLETQIAEREARISPKGAKLPDPAAMKADLKRRMNAALQDREEVQSRMETHVADSKARAHEILVQREQHISNLKAIRPDTQFPQEAPENAAKEMYEAAFDRLEAQGESIEALAVARQALPKLLEPENQHPKVDDLIEKARGGIMESFPEWMRKRSAAPPEKIDLGEAKNGALAGMNLNGKNLSGLNLSGICLKGASLRGTNLSGSNLCGSDLSYTDLTEADLSGADLSQANLTSANLRRSRVQGAVWRKANIEKAALTKLDLTGADFSGATGDLADFREAILSRSRFVEAKLPKGRFLSAIVEGADFSKAELQNAKFIGVKAADACFNDANLTGFRGMLKADFSRASFRRIAGAESIWKTAILDEADFRQANLLRAQFSLASLRNTLLDRCDLKKASFDDASAPFLRLTHCNLLHARFDRADLTDAVLDGSNLFKTNLWQTKLLRTSWENTWVDGVLLPPERASHDTPSSH